jgi:hypothetical protein
VSISSESAEQTIKLILDGTVVVAKISGMAVKNIAVALYTISQDQKQTKGKTRLNNMLKSDNELKIFSIKKEDLKTFYQEAKSYGILYCALINRRNKNIDGMVDIMVRAKDAPQVNRIVERYNLATFDKASIQTEIEKERETTTKAKDISDNVPDLGEERTEVNEDMVEDIFAKPKENVNQNPEAAKTEKSPPSELSLKSKNNSEGVTKPVKKESVKKKLEDAAAELKVETELKEAQKSKVNSILENNKITLEIPTAKNGERGK